MTEPLRNSSLLFISRYVTLMGKKCIVNNACDLFVRFFYTLSTQAHKGTAGAHAQGQFRP